MEEVNIMSKRQKRRLKRMIWNELKTAGGCGMIVAIVLASFCQQFFVAFLLWVIILLCLYIDELRKENHAKGKRNHSAEMVDDSARERRTRAL
jgi:hypothetical protein